MCHAHLPSHQALAIEDKPTVCHFETAVAPFVQTPSLAGPIRPLLDVPSDCVSVVTWPKQVRTDSSLKPPNFERLETSAQDYFNFFSTSWMVVSYQHQKFVADPSAADALRSLPAESYALSCDAPREFGSCCGRGSGGGGGDHWGCC